MRYIRFRVDMVDAEMLEDVVAVTATTSASTMRVDDGVATVGYHGPAPWVVGALDDLGALTRGPVYRTWSASEVAAALPADPLLE